MKAMSKTRNERRPNSRIFQWVVTISILITIFNLILGHLLIRISSPVNSHQGLFGKLPNSEIQSIESRNQNQYLDNSSINENDKQWAVDILESSGIIVDNILFQRLPTWNQVKSLYYQHQDNTAYPIIHGTDSCHKFQQQVPPNERFIAPSGLFNSGTNLLYSLLNQYCDISIDNNTIKSFHTSTSQQDIPSGILDKPPWNKHVPHDIRTTQMFKKPIVDGIQQSHVLPIYITKDPWFWMQSMCRHPYDARGFKILSDSCPSLLQNHQGFLKGRPKSRKINVTFPNGKTFKNVIFESLIDLWIQWHTEYYYDRNKIPQLFIRYEDLLFFPEKVLTTVCECGGGKIVNNEKGIFIMEESVKLGVHPPPYTGLREAVSIYSRVERNDEEDDDPRLNGLNHDEIHFVNSKLLESPMMQAFGYVSPKVVTNI